MFRFDAESGQLFLETFKTARWVPQKLWALLKKTYSAEQEIMRNNRGDIKAYAFDEKGIAQPLELANAQALASLKVLPLSAEAAEHDKCHTIMWDIIQQEASLPPQSHPAVELVCEGWHNARRTGNGRQSSRRVST